jgi:hypothetical protein
VYLFGAAATGVWGFVFFALLDTREFWPTVLGVTVGLIFHGAMYGPQAAFFSEMFGTLVRYSGASIGYQLASVFAGSLAPIIAVALLREYSSGTAVALYLAGAVVITLIAVFLAPETRGRDMGSPGEPVDDQPKSPGLAHTADV